MPAAEPAEPESPPEETPPEDGEPVVIGGSPRATATTAGARVTMQVTGVELSTGASFSVERSVTIDVPPDAVVERRRGAKTRRARLESAIDGERVTITTAPIELALETQLARPGTLLASRLLLAGVERD